MPEPTPTLETARALLRHTLATLAYRAGKAVRGAPDGFAEYRVGDTTRTPRAILAHIGDLMDWAWQLAQGHHVWREASPLPWPGEVTRVFDAIARLDAYLASAAPLGWSADRLFQGPIADALTHVGQLTLLRRLAGAPIRGENYARAVIAVGNVGLTQPSPVAEFG